MEKLIETEYIELHIIVRAERTKLGHATVSKNAYGWWEFFVGNGRVSIAAENVQVETHNGKRIAAIYIL